MDLIQIGEGTTKRFIQNINDNFGKIKNQFDTVAENSIIIDQKNNETNQWSYRIWANGTAECWGIFEITFPSASWIKWGKSDLFWCENMDIIDYPYNILDPITEKYKFLFKTQPQVFISPASNIYSGMMLTNSSKNIKDADGKFMVPSIGALYYDKLPNDRTMKIAIYAIGDYGLGT